MAFFQTLFSPRYYIDSTILRIVIAISWLSCFENNKNTALAAAAATVVSASDLPLNNNIINNNIECHLYLANSTIPNAGLGIFSGIERKKGEIVGDGDICIPIIELNVHHKDTFNPFSDYVWAGEIMGMRMESSTIDIEAFCPGLDCAINCNLALLNVGKATPTFDHYGGLHRSKDPGTGAITPYHNGTSNVIRDIPPGGELFKNYGDGWFLSRSEIFPTLPLSKNFRHAKKILKKYKRLFWKNNQELNNDMDNEISKDLYETIILPMRSTWDNRMMNALPGSYNDLLVALSTDLGMTYQANATRSLEWLAEHGKCVDHIIPKQSTIHGAGRGAFAKRNLPAGTIISGSPLHHIPFKETFLSMYDVLLMDDETDGDGDEEQQQPAARRGNRIVGQQVLVNYCFGHPDTSLLLCPYGSGINYINHNQTLANVKVQWAKHGSTGQNDEWFDKTPMDMLKDDSTKSRFALDYVATRDIQEGEELFLDYGNAWEEAWINLTTGWKMEHSWADIYLNAHEWNERFDDFPLRTIDDTFYDPYPTTLQTRCHVDLSEEDPSVWKEKEEWEWGLNDYGYMCDVLERKRTDNDDGDYYYEYTVWFATEPQDRWDERPYKEMYVSNVPREAIRFFDLPYTTDLHLRKSFRHEIGLPDELMHDAWRNLLKKTPPPAPKGSSSSNNNNNHNNNNNNASILTPPGSMPGSMPAPPEGSKLQATTTTATTTTATATTTPGGGGGDDDGVPPGIVEANNNSNNGHGGDEL